MPLLPAGMEVAEAISEQICSKDSDPSPFERIDSASCGVYRELTGYRTADAGQPILLRYMVHAPRHSPKGVVVLIAGGLLQTGIMGDAVTGIVTNAGANFLVRSAQIFADKGYLAVTIHRPVKLTDPPAGEFPDEGIDRFRWDHYRIVSPKHAYDIVRVVARENTSNLPLFLAGTSRGALSVVSGSMPRNGVLISSPVTSGPTVPGCPPDPTCALYVDYHSGYPRLEPGSVVAPVHVMAHEADACSVTTPVSAATLHAAFVASGIDSRFDVIRGGFALPGEDACKALHFHGFLGQENRAVKAHTKRMDDILAHWRHAFPANLKPVAVPGTMSSADAYTLDLATLVRTRAIPAPG